MFWGAHAIRVPFSAARRKPLSNLDQDAKEPFGESPNGARESRALPGKNPPHSLFVRDETFDRVFEGAANHARRIRVAFDH